MRIGGCAKGKPNVCVQTIYFSSDLLGPFLKLLQTIKEDDTMNAKVYGKNCKTN